MDIRCPKCNRAYTVAEELRGAVVECGSCGVIFEVPQSGTVGVYAENLPTIQVTCPGCHTSHQVPGNARGLEAECMVCKRTFRIPDRDAAVARPPSVTSPTAPARPALTPPGRPGPGAAAGGSPAFKDTSTIRLNRSKSANPTDNTFQAFIPPPAAPPPKPVAAPPVAPPAATLRPATAAPAQPAVPLPAAPAPTPRPAS